MTELEELKFYAKYPFSKEAKQFIEFYNFTFDKITPEFLESVVDEIKKYLEPITLLKILILLTGLR